MKQLAAVIVAVALGLGLSAARAAESAQQIASGETNEQKCGRWAEYQGLKDSVHAEYIQDCLRELRHPDNADGGGDD
jgi:hypothetical protein